MTGIWNPLAMVLVLILAIDGLVNAYGPRPTMTSLHSSIWLSGKSGGMSGNI